MPRHRDHLPQLDGSLFLTDGGIETTMIFHEGLELPDFAAFHLLRDAAGTEALRRYFRGYAALAARHDAGLVLESPTWRASADWGARLGYDAESLAEANRRAIALLEEVRAEWTGDPGRVVLSGNLGPRGDGYNPTALMSAAEAADYHAPQIRVFAGTEADLVTAITMNYEAEAIGIAQAARGAGVPVVLAFTVETDGRLPTGQTLRDAIRAVDDATGAYPAYYMINCAHPTHFESVLEPGAEWSMRLRGLRANASRMSHAELNESPVLDAGDPEEFGREHAEACTRLPGLNVLGGCCGTDERHVDWVAVAVAPLFRPR